MTQLRQVCRQAQADPARGVPVADGARGAVVGAASAHRATLFEGRSWSPTISAGDNAAHPLVATVVRAERSVDGRGAVRDHARCVSSPGCS